MKEFLLVVVVLFGLMFFFRAFFTPKTAPAPTPVYRPSAAELEDMRIKATRRKMLRWLGAGLLVVGGVVLASVFKLFDVVMTWYGLSLLIILAGVVVLVFSFRR